MYKTHAFTPSYTHLFVTDLPMYNTDTLINRLKQHYTCKRLAHTYTHRLYLAHKKEKDFMLGMALYKLKHFKNETLIYNQQSRQIPSEYQTVVVHQS